MQKLVFRNGKGTEIDLTSGCYGITEWSGFSADGLNIQSQQVPFQDGAVFLDALMEQRDLSVTLAINDENNLETRYQKRRELIALMNPKLGEGLLIYTNDFISKQIHVIPQLPVFQNKNSNDAGTPKASLSWVACNPYWEDVEETEIVFERGFVQNVENNGDIPAQLEIDFLSVNMKNPSIQNIKMGKKISYNGTLYKSLSINTNAGKKNVLAKNIMFNENQYSAYSNNSVYFCESLLMFFMLSGNVVKYSYDAEKWLSTTDDISGDETLNSIAYSPDAGIFVLCGKNYVYTSKDGISWEYLHSGSLVTVAGGTYVYYSTNKKQFILVQNISGHYSTYNSSDGITWTKIENLQHMNGVTYSTSSKFIFVGDSGAIYTTNTNFENLTAQTSGVSVKLNSIANNNNKLVAVGNSGTILYSTNGVNWLVKTSGTTRNLYSVIWCNDLSLYVACGAYGVILTSSDGDTWNIISTGLNLTLNSVAFSSFFQKIYVCGNSGILYNSSDAVTWDRIDDNLYSNLNSVVFAKNKFVAVGNNLKPFTSDENGENWSGENINANFYINKLIYNSESDVYAGVGGTDKVYFSTDLINWTSYIAGNYLQLNAIIYSSEKNLYIAVGVSTYSGIRSVIVTSSNGGLGWIERTVSTSEGLNSITYSRNLDKFVAVGNNGTILYSTNGIDWSVASSGVSNDLKDVVYVDFLEKFLAGGANGRNLTSSDGVNWVAGTSTSITITSIAFSNKERLIAVCGGNYICLSNNGKRWTSTKNISSQTLNSIAYSDKLNKFVVVGDASGIYTSYYATADNLIQNITSDSDINFNFETGLNQIRVITDSGEVTTVVKFRQKYIGV